jgi:Ca2+-binding RTX toxin-like protein
MGTYTGTSGHDLISPDDLSPGVDASPSGTRPGNGNDILYGLAGNDTLWGGGGRDRLYGGAGLDDLFSTGNRSILRGGAGMDALTSSGDHSIMYGGAGHDNLVCSLGGDQTLFGQGAPTSWKPPGETTG